jgi:hypothetical protein
MKSEPRAAARGILESDPSSLSFRDFARDGEPETGASGLGGEERLEDSLANLRGHSRPVVFDGEHDFVRVLFAE